MKWTTMVIRQRVFRDTSEPIITKAVKWCFGVSNSVRPVWPITKTEVMSDKGRTVARGRLENEPWQIRRPRKLLTNTTCLLLCALLFVWLLSRLGGALCSAPVGKCHWCFKNDHYSQDQDQTCSAVGREVVRHSSRGLTRLNFFIFLFFLWFCIDATFTQGKKQEK